VKRVEWRHSFFVVVDSFQHNLLLLLVTDSDEFEQVGHERNVIELVAFPSEDEFEIRERRRFNLVFAERNFCRLL
jgi:hypothetical protein